MNTKVVFQTIYWFLLLLTVLLYNEFSRSGLPDASGIGHKDDQSVALVILSLIIFLQAFSSLLTKALTFIITLSLSFFAIINWWFYDFYRDYVTFSIYKLAGYTQETSLAWEGLNYKSEALTFMVTMAVMLLFIFFLSKYKPSKKSHLIVAFIVLLLGIQQQYEVSNRALGGLKHPGINHVSYFIKSISPQEKIDINEEHVKHLAKVLKSNDFGKIDINYPLFRKTEHHHSAKKQNVIIVVLESVRAFESGLYAKDAPSIMPNLKAFADESINFTDFYANSNQTVRGEVAILCSALDYINGSPFSISGSLLQTNCLTSILKENDYETYWIHGYEKSFFNREEFFPKIGFNHLVDIAKLEEDGPKDIVGWGVSDIEMFDYALTFLEQKEQPFFAEVLTLSNHYPYLWDWKIEFPKELELKENLIEGSDNLYPAYRRGVYYTDYALGQFLDRFKKSELYEDTLLIITGDHGIWTFTDDLLNSNSKESEFKKNEMYFRLPLLMHYKGVKAKDIDMTASQIDIAPTVLDYLGIDYESAFMGESLLKDKQSNSVFFMASGSYGLRRDNLYCYPVSPCELVKGYKKCDSYQIVESESSCAFYQGELLTNDSELEITTVNQTSEDILIDLSQHYLEYGFLPENKLIEKNVIYR